MNRLTSRGIRTAFAVLLMAAGFAPAASAVTELRAHIDIDNNDATGCPLPLSSVAGADFELVTTIDTDVDPPQVTGLALNQCTGGVFVAYVGPSPFTLFAPPWSASAAPGGDAIETYLPLSVGDPGVEIQLGLRSNIAGANVDPRDTLAPIVVQGISLTEIPTLGEWGLILLALALAAAGSVFLRRRSSRQSFIAGLLLLTAGLGIAFAASPHAPNDNSILDWQGHTAITDPVDSQPNLEILRAFATVEGGVLHIRADMDLQTNQAAIATNDGATVNEDASATVINVLLNDSDPEGNPFAVIAVQNPSANGGTVINNGTDVSYTPPANYCNTQPGGTPDTFTYTITGGDTATVSVTVTCLNDAPVLTPGGGLPPTFNEGSPAVTVDPGLTVTDVDNANLASATVTITNPLDGAAEVLAAPSCAGLTVTPGVNSLSITGSQPLATYQTCLRSVTYENTSNTPNTTPRNVAFVVNDGTANSNTATTVVNVAPSADAPVLADTGTVNFTEDGGPIVVAPAITVADADDVNLESATVTIANPLDGAAEVLAATSCAGLTVTPGVNTLSITGSQPLATYQTCLQSVTYDNTSQDPDTTSRSVQFVANDGDSNGNTATATVTITAVNDAPVVTTTGGSTAFTEAGGPVVVDSGVTVTDVDNANLASATVTITNPQDGAAEVLAATSCAGLTVTPGLNTLSIAGSQPLATYQTCLQSVTYDNTSQDPDTTARVISFVANDGTASSAPANKTVTLAAVDNAPVVTTTAGTTAFTEDGGPVVVDSGVTVTDADSANLASAMVTITNPQDGAAEVLAATSCAGLTVTPGVNTLSITGSQPLATYQTCLQSVTYNNTSQNPNTTARVISFVANDGTASSAPATKTVTMAASNDAPVVTTTGGNTAFTEDGGPVAVDSGVTVTDVDSANLASATVTITNPLDGAAEVLAATSCAGLTVTPGLNTLSITGSQPLATYQTCLQSVTYNNTSQDPNTTARVISFVANDGTASSTPATKTVTVATVNDAPVVTTTGGSTPFTEDGGAVVVDAGVTVTDADSANLASATVTITNPQDGAAEVLGATSCAGLTVTPGLNSLSITGSQPLATYQTCLQSVTYNNTSQSPGTTPRVISFVANDGTASSVPATKTVTVAATDDAPVVTTTAGTTAFTEDGGPVVVDSGATVTDADSANLASATVTITNPQDGAAEVLAATSCAGLTVTPGVNTLSITGSQSPATYQTCLQSVTYNNTSQNPDTTARVISFVANDGTASSAPATKTVTVAAVADAPEVTTTAGTTSFTEDAGAVVVDAGVTVTDGDSANLASATVTITNPQDGAAEVLGATSCAGLTVTPGLNTLSITGSQPLATYQTCLQSVIYNNTSQNPGTTARVISFVANDGTASSVPATKTVTVTPVNDAPVVTTTVGLTSFTEDAGAVVVDSGVTVSDVDNANLSSATVTISNPLDGAAETLGATNCAGLTVTPGLNTLSITGSQPLATYQTCLQSVTYNNSSQNPNATNRTVSFVVNDGTASSLLATKTVTVTPVNDAPTITTTTVTYTALGNTQLHVEGKVLAGVVAVTDAQGVDAKAGPFTDPDGPVAPSIVDAAGATANGGSFDIDTNGSFTYVPPVGFTGTDSFTYQVTDSLVSAVGTVSITVSELVWYVRDVVDADNPAAGDTGRSTNPFEILGDVEPVVTDNDFIFVFEGNTGATPLNGGVDIDNTGVKLHGEGIGLTVPGFGTLIPAGNRPRITNTGAAGAPEDNGVNVIATAASLAGVEIRGLDISGRDNGIDVTATGVNSAGVRISENTISSDPTNGSEGVDVNASSTGTVTLAIHNNNPITARGTAIDITRTSGTVVITAFNDNVISGDSNGAGIIVTGPATFDATPGGALDPVLGGTTVIGTSINAITGAGLTLGSVTGALDFGDLDVFAGTSGVVIAGTGAFTGAAGTRVTVPNGLGIVQAANGPGVDVSNATLDLRLATLTVSASPSTGVSLVNVSDGTVAPTSAFFSAGSGSSITNVTGTDFNVDGGNATVSYAGSINNTAGRSVAVQNRTGDSVTFTSTSTITDNGTGILVNANAAGAVTDFLGTLTMSTGANNAFTATSGGTLRVMGATNTIATTTGVALNVTNTTIGAGGAAPETGLRFRSISAGTGGSGPTNGIVLNTTGALGSLTVTGDGGGSNNGSGGIIQNTTAEGILLNSTNNVSLGYLNITNSGTDSIRITNINGFTLNRSNIDDAAGTAPADKAIDVGDFSTGTAVNGAINITNNVIGPAAGNSPHDSLAVGIGSGTSTWSVANTTFRRTGNSGINLELRGTAVVSAFNVDTCTFAGAGFATSARGVFANNLDDSVMTLLTVQNSSFTNNNIHIDINQQNDTDPVGSSEFAILSNTTMTGARSHAINVFSAAGAFGGGFEGTISGNIIGNAGVADSGSAIGNGIRININGGATSAMLLNNNVIRQTPNGRGIEIIGRNGTGGLDVTVTNNDVNPQATANPLAAILVQSNCLTICNNVSADVRGNTVPSATDVTDLLTTYIALVESGASTLELVDTTAPISGTCASELAATNTGSTGVLGGCSLIAGPITVP